MVAALALSGRDAGTASPLSVKSSTSGSGTRLAAYAAASLARRVPLILGYGGWAEGEEIPWEISASARRSAARARLSG